MVEGAVVVNNRLGLHARAAARLVKEASRFESRIIVGVPDGSITANAKSILSVLSLAASKGKKLSLSVDGKDEKEAFETIIGLFASGFGEE